MTDDVTAALRKRLASKKLEIDGETYWVAEGDLLLDADQLAEYAQQRANLEAQKDLRRRARDLGMAFTAPTGSVELVGILSGGKLLRWKDGLTLSYCVLRNTFSSEREYKIVRDGMAEATEAWEKTCGVNFRHRASLDKSATTQVAGVKFTVRALDAGGRFIAAAFFPNDPPARRRVIIDPSFFSDDLGFDRVGVLRHELGHVVGFRHEHIRSDAPPVCPDEDTVGTINLTDYDPKSVMHYFCGGVGSAELRITEIDMIGAQRLYGQPLSEYKFVE